MKQGPDLLTALLNTAVLDDLTEAAQRDGLDSFA